MTDLVETVDAVETVAQVVESIAETVDPKAVKVLTDRVTALETLLEHAFVRFFGANALTEAKQLIIKSLT